MLALSQCYDAKERPVTELAEGGFCWEPSTQMPAWEAYLGQRSYGCGCTPRLASNYRVLIAEPGGSVCSFHNSAPCEK